MSTLTFLILFYGFFIIIVLISVFVFVFFYNQRSKVALDKFILSTEDARSIFFENIKLSYRVDNKGRTQVYPNNQCNLLLFENQLAIVRRQYFIYKVLFPPILLTSDIAITQNTFNYIKSYKPEKIVFRQTRKGVVDINLRDSVYQNYRIYITFKELTDEQIKQLEVIKTWCL